MQKALRSEGIHGDNKATWAAYAARGPEPNIRESVLLKELERWRWDVVRALVKYWDAAWQDAEDAFSAFLLDVALALAGRDTSKHTTRDQVLAPPKGQNWLPFLVYRAKNRLWHQRANHLSVSHTDAVDPDSDVVAIVDDDAPAPGSALEQREKCDEVLVHLRRTLVGKRGSDLQFRVVAARLLGLDYAEIGLRLHRSAAGCRVAHAKALARLPNWLLDRLGGRRKSAA